MGDRVYVGNLPPGIHERDLEDEFIRFGRIRSVWVARKPPGFAFIEYEDVRDADDAVARLDGYRGWRVELSKRGPRSSRARSPPPPRRRSPVRSESPPRRRRSPSYDRSRRRSDSRSPPRRGSRRSSRRDSRSPRRSRRDSRSPRRSLSP
ncbi:hypothetical protein DUNSADRAFT_18071 [Dunaliella salina]|uniref:RRM domain-containing protein n=1 Tax=Dunaliella salina TaxID=3046 RepID=A0ABQ7G0R1_DUNSA|nr:hypothetical protein DUNSADRAFT_18071 [Dunaliella salina]|eukprot:KAF5828193.1 hypothetical protein DUNSADRAFT_18071 [Dunaliella salina]